MKTSSRTCSRPSRSSGAAREVRRSESSAASLPCYDVGGILRGGGLGVFLRGDGGGGEFFEEEHTAFGGPRRGAGVGGCRFRARGRGAGRGTGAPANHPRRDLQ